MIAYQCYACQHTFTRIAEGQAKECPACHVSVQRLKITHADGVHKKFVEPVVAYINRAAGPDD